MSCQPLAVANAFVRRERQTGELLIRRSLQPADTPEHVSCNKCRGNWDIIYLLIVVLQVGPSLVDGCVLATSYGLPMVIEYGLPLPFYHPPNISSRTWHAALFCCVL